MKLRFIDSPKLILPTKLPPTALKTKNSINKVWGDWAKDSTTAFPAPQSPEPNFTAHELAIALMSDFRNQLPFRHAMSLVSTFIDEAAPELSFHQHLAAGSQRFKAISSELVGTMVAIAYARKCGHQFLGSMSDVNKLSPNAWTRPWTGNGPDFLFASTGGLVTFVEAKGTGAAAGPKKNIVDKDFVRQKVQSLNAKLDLPTYLTPPNEPRFVLSRVTMEANCRVQLQWFNQAAEKLEKSERVSKPLVLAVALGNFRQIGRAQSVHLARRIFVEDDVIAFLPHESPGDGVLKQRFPRDTVFARRSTRYLFDAIEDLLDAFGTRLRWSSGLKSIFESEVEGLFAELTNAQTLDAGPLLGQKLSAAYEQKVVGLPMGYAVAL